MSLHSAFISPLLTEEHQEKWILNKNNRLFLYVLCNRWQQPVWLNGQWNASDRELHLLLPHPLSAALHGPPAAPEAERAHRVFDWSKLWVSALTLCLLLTHWCMQRWGMSSSCLTVSVSWWVLQIWTFLVDNGKIFLFVCGPNLKDLLCEQCPKFGEVRVKFRCDAGQTNWEQVGLGIVV